jgi:hypothetical protein
LTTHRTDRILTSIIGYTEGLTTKLPNARTHLRQLINSIDGFPVGADTDTPSGGGLTLTITHRDDPTIPEDQVDRVPATAVELAAHRRSQLELDLGYIDATLNDVVKSLLKLHRECDRIIGTRIETPRCDGGTGREGHLLPRAEGGWSDPSCHNVPSEGRKTCDSCRQRFHRWAREHGHHTAATA